MSSDDRPTLETASDSMAPSGRAGSVGRPRRHRTPSAAAVVAGASLITLVASLAPAAPAATRPGAPGSNAAVEPGPDGLCRQVAAQAVAGARASVHGCYATALAADGGAAYDVVATVAFGPAGRVEAVALRAGSSLPDPFAACVRRRLARVRATLPEPRPTEVAVPFTFRPR